MDIGGYSWGRGWIQWIQWETGWIQVETLSLEVSLELSPAEPSLEEALSVWLAPEALAADELTGREAPGL